jgi:potassium-transporting ATPase KdpC subunit
MPEDPQRESRGQQPEPGGHVAPAAAASRPDGVTDRAPTADLGSGGEAPHGGRARRYAAQARRAVVVLIAMVVLLGLIYPLFITGVGQAFFNHKANGSIISSDGQATGSELIGQPFSAPGYFWSRPSATSPFPYNGDASGGSNLGPTNPALLTAISDRIAKLRSADPGNSAPVPIDLITASGSGLDPNISPAAAEYQVTRVAKARGMSSDAVRVLVRKYTRGRQLGFLGEPRVNVLELNLALDALQT